MKIDKKKLLKIKVLKMKIFYFNPNYILIFLSINRLRRD